MMCYIVRKAAGKTVVSTFVFFSRTVTSNMFYIHFPLTTADTIVLHWKCGISAVEGSTNQHNNNVDTMFLH